MNTKELNEIVAACDPGVRRLVRLLNDYGFETTDSGDGVTKVGTMGCALNYPNVFISVPECDDLKAECDRLKSVLTDKGVEFPELDESRPSTPAITGSYNPVDKHKIIELANVTDSMIERETVFMVSRYGWSDADIIGIFKTIEAAKCGADEHNKRLNEIYEERRQWRREREKEKGEPVLSVEDDHPDETMPYLEKMVWSCVMQPGGLTRYESPGCGYDNTFAISEMEVKE